MKLQGKHVLANPRKHIPLITASILALTGLIVFSNTYSNGFHLDDFHTIVFNSHVHTLEEIPTFFISGIGFSGTPFVSGYRPVTAAVNSFDYVIGHSNPYLYHLTNLIFHLLSSFLVAQVAFTLSKNPSFGLLSGLVFLVHPMNTEVVNYISARSSSLSALFSLASFLAFLSYRKKNEIKWIVFSLVIFIFSLGSKEVSITFPLLLIAYDYFYVPDLPLMKKIKIWAIYLLPVILFLVARHYFMNSMNAHSSTTSSAEFQLFDKLKIVSIGSLYLSTHYLFLYLFPYPLSFDHLFPVPKFGLQSLLFFLFWILIATGMIIYRKKKLAPFLLSWFIINLLPLFLLPAISTVSLFQENRSYLSGAGICMLISLGIMKTVTRSRHILTNRVRWIPIFIVVCILIGLSLASYSRNRAWKSEITLWTDVLIKNPGSFIATFSLGYGYLTDGKMEQAGYYFNKSLELSPPREYLYYIHNNLGAVYESRGEIEKAFDEYQVAARLSPNLPEAHLNLGNFYLKKGNYEEALKEMGAAIDIEHGHMEQRVRVAIEMENHGARKEAQQLFLRISNVLPASSEYQNLRDLIKPHLPDL